MSRKANLSCAAFGLLPRQLQLASELLMIRRFFVFSQRGCPGAGCPIIMGYRTTSVSFVAAFFISSYDTGHSTPLISSASGK